jgi:TonB family protein
MMNSFRSDPAVMVEKLKNNLNLMVRYARTPYGIAIIGSVALHVVVAIALPLWSGSKTEEQTKRPQVVRVVELPDDIQSRLPSNSQELNLSVFDKNPNFNIDLSAIDPSQMPPGFNGSIPQGLEFFKSSNRLPVPGVPGQGQVNFSFIPNSNPAPIRSVYSGFAPPPPSMISGFLPPPPNVPARFNASTINPDSLSTFSPNFSTVPGNNNGDRQSFAITPQPNPDLIQRQRQLEQGAAIALDNNTFSPNSPNIEFRASQLRPNDPNSNPADRLPKPQQTATAPTTTRQNTTRQSIRGNYPKNACSSKASGTVTYNVTVASSGVPSQWSLNSSSGSNILDNQASQDIRNTRFDGSISNYLVSVSYSYQPSFCSAFQAPPRNNTPATPTKPAPTPPAAAPTPAPEKPKPITQEISPPAIEAQPKPQPTITIPSEPLRLPASEPTTTPEVNQEN